LESWIEVGKNGGGNELSCGPVINDPETRYNSGAASTRPKNRMKKILTARRARLRVRLLTITG
jgi:hypothetical protein